MPRASEKSTSSVASASSTGSRIDQGPSRKSSVLSAVSRLTSTLREIQVDRPKKRFDVPKEINRIKGLIGGINYFFFVLNLYAFLKVSEDVLKTYFVDCYEAGDYQKSIDGASYVCRGNTLVQEDFGAAMLLTLFAIAHSLHVISLVCGAFGFWFLHSINVVLYIVLFLGSSIGMIAVVLVEAFTLEFWFKQTQMDFIDIVLVVVLFVIEIIVYLIGLATYIRWLSHLKDITQK